MDKEPVLAAAIALLVSMLVPLMGNPSFLATGTVNLARGTGNATNITVLLNGIDGDISFESGNTVNITVLFGGSNMTFYLDTNISGWTTQSGNETVPLMQYVTLVTPGIYNITGWFPQSPADSDYYYLPSISTHWINVTAPPAITPPVVPPGPPGGGGGFGPPGPSNITPGKPKWKLEVIVIDDRNVLVNGTYLPPGQYYAEMSKANELPVTMLMFMLTQEKEHIRIIIERIPKPEVMPALEEQYPPVMPYGYFKVTVLGADPQAAFNITTMAFRVERAWILSQAINESTIRLYSFWNQWLPITGAAVAGPVYEYQNGWIPTSTTKTGQDGQYSTFIARNMRGFTTYYAVAGDRIPGPFQLVMLPSYVGPYYMQLIIVLLAIALMFLYAERKAGPKARSQAKESLAVQFETRKATAQRKEWKPRLKRR